MPPLIKIVSFYTNDVYHQATLRLEQSLKGEFYEISKVEASSWAEAVIKKPQFVYDQLANSGNIDGVLWTDADSTMEGKPDWSGLVGMDFGAVFWTRPGQQEEEILTGSFYVGKTKLGLDLLREWAFETPKYKHHFTPEQASLKEVLAREEFKEAKIKKLGVEWVYVFDDMKELYPQVNPIFTHYQMSRVHRHG